MENVRAKGKYPYVIYGKTTAAIAETATFFWSLQHSGNICLKIDSSASCRLYNRFDSSRWFDCAALSPEQLAQILDSNLTRHYAIRYGSWTAEQSVILATRPYPLHLSLTSYGSSSRDFDFQDGGTAFGDALENRTSSFGTLGDAGNNVLRIFTLRRLFHLDKFDKLAIDSLAREDALLSLSAKAKAMSCEVCASSIQSEDFSSVDILTKDLCFRIHLEEVANWYEKPVSFLNRVAELGHLERLEFSAFWYNAYEKQIQPAEIARVTDAIIRVIHSNPHLIDLDLSRIPWLMKCYPQLEIVLVALEGHTGLRTFVVNSNYIAEYQLFSWLERLLSRNRNIEVLNIAGKRLTNGTTIDTLYSINRVYKKSATLLKESLSLRPLLMATALAECASEKFAPTALLLAHHADMLCEFVDGLDLDSSDADEQALEDAAVSPVSTPSGSHRTAASKRTRVQPSRAIKKCRKET